MKKMLAGIAVLILIACAAFGCDSKPDANDPTNKQNVLKEGSDASATSGGAPVSGKGLAPGTSTTLTPPPPK